MRFAAALLALAAAPVALSQTQFPNYVDRPSFSDGPYIVPKGHWELEGGFTITSADGDKSTTWGEFSFRFPLSQREELALQNGTYQTGPARAKGFQDPAIRFKDQIQTAVQGKRPALGAVFLTTVPAGDKNFRTDAYQPTAKLVCDYPVNGNLSVGGNLIVSELGPSGARFTQYGWSAYAATGVGPTSSAFFETYALLPEAAHGPDALFSQIGLSHQIGKVDQIDFRIGEGWNESRDGWWFGAGFAHEFKD